MIGAVTNWLNTTKQSGTLVSREVIFYGSLSHNLYVHVQQINIIIKGSRHPCFLF